MSDLVPISVSSPKSDIDDEVIQFLRRQRDQSVITEEMFSCLVANRRKERTVVGRDASLSAKSEESEFDEEDDIDKKVQEATTEAMIAASRKLARGIISTEEFRHIHKVLHESRAEPPVMRENGTELKVPAMSLDEELRSLLFHAP